MCPPRCGHKLRIKIWYTLQDNELLLRKMRTWSFSSPRYDAVCQGLVIRDAADRNGRA